VSYVGEFTPEDIRRLQQNQCIPNFPDAPDGGFIWKVWDSRLGTRYLVVSNRNITRPTAALSAAYEFVAYFGLDNITQGVTQRFATLTEKLAIEGLEPLQDQLLDLMRTPNGISLALVIDNTGSMADDINAVKAAAAKVVNQLACTPNARVAVVTYNDPSTRIEVNFSTDRQAIINAINGISVGGGGDTPEVVYSGIMTAVGLGWKDTDTNSIIVMGDAPPKDPEPGTGYTLAQVIAAAQSSNINASFSSEMDSQYAALPHDGIAPSPDRGQADAPVAPALPSPAPHDDSTDLTSLDPSVRSDSAVLAAAPTGSSIMIHSVMIGSDSSALTAFQALADGTSGTVTTAATATNVVDALIVAISAAQVGPMPWKETLEWYGGTGSMSGVKRVQQYVRTAYICDRDPGYEYAFMFALPERIEPSRLRWWANNVSIDQQLKAMYGANVPAFGVYNQTPAAYLCLQDTRAALPGGPNTVKNELRLSW
jgi:hypothetical protein